MAHILIKRVYEPFEKADGFRILVDRLWPRGMKKETAHIDVWMKEVSPSTALRKAFHQDTSKWTDFNKAYKAELKNSPAINELVSLCKEHKTVTFLYAAKDEQHNHAQILLKYISPLLKK